MYPMCFFLFELQLKTPMQLRNNSFPVFLGGKAYDTAIVGAWLESEMAIAKPAAWRCIVSAVGLRPHLKCILQLYATKSY